MELAATGFKKNSSQGLKKGPGREAKCPQLKAVAKGLAGTRPNYIHGFTVAVIIRQRRQRTMKTS